MIRARQRGRLAGGSIEDFTGDRANPIYGFNLAVERVYAAVETARSLPIPFVLTARAEQLIHGSTDLDDTIKRLQAFEQAGADVLYAPGLKNLDMIRTVVVVGVEAGQCGDDPCRPVDHRRPARPRSGSSGSASAAAARASRSTRSWARRARWPSTAPSPLSARTRPGAQLLEGFAKGQG